MWPFKRRRVVEVQGIFIPQYYELFEGWYAYDRGDIGNHWCSLKCQIEYCSYPTLEEARASFVNIKVHKA